MARRSPSGVLDRTLPSQGVEIPMDTRALPPSSTRQNPITATRAVLRRVNASTSVMPLMESPTSTAAKKAAAIVPITLGVNGWPKPIKAPCSAARPRA